MAKSSHIKLLLVRAGASAWDDAGRISGSADLPLSDPGRAAVQALTATIEDGALCQVWTGPEESAQATATAIASAAGAKLKTLSNLHELGVGLWEGLDESDGEDRGGKAFRQWQKDPTLVVPPGGETVADAESRVLNQTRSLLAKCRGDETCGLAIVLRPMVYGIVRCWLTGEPLSALQTTAWESDMAEQFLVDRESVRDGSAPGPGAVRTAG